MRELFWQLRERSERTLTREWWEVWAAALWLIDQRNEGASRCPRYNFCTWKWSCSSFLSLKKKVLWACRFYLYASKRDFFWVVLDQKPLPLLWKHLEGETKILQYFTPFIVRYYISFLFCKQFSEESWNSSETPWVKDPVLSLQRLRFDPWPRNFGVTHTHTHTHTHTQILTGNHVHIFQITEYWRMLVFSFFSSFGI